MTVITPDDNNNNKKNGSQSGDIRSTGKMNQYDDNLQSAITDLEVEFGAEFLADNAEKIQLACLGRSKRLQKHVDPDAIVFAMANVYQRSEFLEQPDTTASSVLRSKLRMPGKILVSQAIGDKPDYDIAQRLGKIIRTVDDEGNKVNEYCPKLLKLWRACVSNVQHDAFEVYWRLEASSFETHDVLSFGKILRTFTTSKLAELLGLKTYDHTQTSELQTASLTAENTLKELMQELQCHREELESADDVFDNIDDIIDGLND